MNKVNSIKIKNEILDTTQVREDAPSIENLIGKIRTVNNIFNPFDEDTRSFLFIIVAELTPIT